MSLDTLPPADRSRTAPPPEPATPGARATVTPAIVLRSLAYVVVFNVFTFVCCLLLLGLLAVPRRWMMAVVEAYMRALKGLERVILGLDYRVVGREHLPDGPCIVAAKHQSLWETMTLHLLVADPSVVLKQELMDLPMWGWYARKAGMIGVRRGGGAPAIRRMVADARAPVAAGRPLIIFPQGTRTAPGVWRRYRGGVAALYEALDLPVVPLALNAGMFWGRRRFLKFPGTITLEFLPPIPAGLPTDEMMPALVDRLEAATDALVVDAGGTATERPADPAAWWRAPPPMDGPDG